MKAKILIVDDEPDILTLLEYNLDKEGYKVEKALDGQEAISLVERGMPDMILLDIMMPLLDGVETCRRIRELPNGDAPFIVFLTARSEEYSELAGFDAGADDYITKPIRPRLLLTRIKAIFRRGRSTTTLVEDGNELEVHDLRILRDEYLVYKDGKAINLPKKEFQLLDFLASRPGKVFSREILLEKVWGTNVHVVDRTIDVHIRKLREKIGKKYIKTVKGVGYKFVNET